MPQLRLSRNDHFVHSHHRHHNRRRIPGNLKAFKALVGTLEALRAWVGGLGGRNKELVDGYYFKGNSLKRIAEFLNMSPSAAKVAMHRARLAIGKCLRRKGGE